MSDPPVEGALNRPISDFLEGHAYRSISGPQCRQGGDKPVERPTFIASRPFAASRRRGGNQRRLSCIVNDLPGPLSCCDPPDRL